MVGLIGMLGVGCEAESAGLASQDLVALHDGRASGAAGLLGEPARELERFVQASEIHQGLHRPGPDGQGLGQACARFDQGLVSPLFKAVATEHLGASTGGDLVIAAWCHDAGVGEAALDALHALLDFEDSCAQSRVVCAGLQGTLEGPSLALGISDIAEPRGEIQEHGPGLLLVPHSGVGHGQGL